MNKSYIVALIVLILIAGWIGSGYVRQDENLAESDQEVQAQDTTPTTSAERDEMSVRVKTMTAQDRVNELTVRGRTEANRMVAVRAETAGRIVELPVPKGSVIAKGESLCRIAENERRERMREMNAMMKQRDLEYRVAQELVERGHRSEVKGAEAKAAYESARASVRMMEIELANTVIKAPFDGFVEEIPVEMGDLLQVGQVCAHIVDMNPMLVVGQVSERDVGRLKLGDVGHALTSTGLVVEGKLRYVGKRAEPTTRTYRVELEVWNGDYELRDGMTAEIYIPKEAVKAHRISPSVLTLDDAGNIGVRIVNNDNKVEFHQIEVVADEQDGVWVTGLPKKVRLITVGHEYVVEGQNVNPVEEKVDGSEDPVLSQTVGTNS